MGDWLVQLVYWIMAAIILLTLFNGIMEMRKAIQKDKRKHALRENRNYFKRR